LSQNKKRKKKAPQIAITVLLFACPVALAEQAQAQTRSTSYDRALLGEQRQLSLHQIGTANQSLLPLGMSPNQSLAQFPFASPLSFLKSSTPEEYQEQVRLATVALNKAKSALQTALTSQSGAEKALETAQVALDRAISALEQANSAQSEQSDALSTAERAKDDAQATYDRALDEFVKADDLLTTKANATATALANLTTAQNVVINKTSSLTTSNLSLASAQSSLSTAQANQQQAQQTYDQAVIAYNQAKQIANQPTYYIQPTSYQIPDANFMTGNEWIGDGSGQSGQPEIHPGHIHFSYVATEVYQDILLYPRIIANYTYTVAVWNQDQNSVNQGPVADQYGLGIILYDANDNIIHQDSMLSTEVHGWRDVTIQGNNPNISTPVAKVRIVVAGVDNGFWAGTYGPAMNNVRLLMGWAIENAPAQSGTATMSVDIGEGGESTFTAPAGSTFISSNLRYESYNNPSCGADVTPQGLGGNTIQLVADNSVWGDPCGGEQKHLVGTLTYTAQAEPDPSYALSVTQAQTALSNSNNAVLVAQQAIANIQATVSTNTSDLSEAQEDLTVATTAYATAQSEQQEVASDRSTASANKDSAQSALSSATSLYEAELSNNSTLESKQSEAESAKSVAEDSYALSADALEEASSQVSEAEAEVESAQEALDSIPEPEPTPEPEEPEAPEIPEGDPRELSEEEVEELVSEAEAVLESAEQGSPAYEQALEALAVAAQADDPQVPEELLAIPLLGETAAAVLEAFNDLGNVGADMAPAVREEAEKTIIASVIATGAAVQAVQAAAASAASVAASSTSSSTTRRSN
jgi:hypothetical protein